MDRVPFETLATTLQEALEREGFETGRARACAILFAEASRDGVHSHGLNRFPRFIRSIRRGVVDVDAQPVLLASRGCRERWDGRAGPGNLNAWHCMGRAIDLAREHGLGCVAIANTNHWMRAGAYGWQAADAGMVGICWTNTLPNLPPWGSARPLVGNNPLVIAVPRPSGHVVLDMAMSQFSYGALEGYARRGERLPVVGGFDSAGELTDDASAILASSRPLPTGFWKGSGLALLLDILAATFADGNATSDIGPDPELEGGLSQVFLAIDPDFGGGGDPGGMAERIVAQLHGLEPGIRYPGQRVLEERARSLAEGVAVDATIWRSVTGRGPTEPPRDRGASPPD